jgi:hypothetical protein
MHPTTSCGKRIRKSKARSCPVVWRAAEYYCGKFIRRSRSWKRGSERKVPDLGASGPAGPQAHHAAIQVEEVGN